MTRIKEKWHLYLVKCSDKSIYTGIAKNVHARIEKHNQGKGARYTSTRRPVKLIYSEQHDDRISAMKRELKIKRWPKEKKLALATNKK